MAQVWQAQGSEFKPQFYQITVMIIIRRTRTLLENKKNGYKPERYVCSFQAGFYLGRISSVLKDMNDKNMVNKHWTIFIHPKDQ
jgi:hypothetical protein